MRELVEEGFLRFTYVKTKENKADPYTKNVNAEINDMIMNDYIMKKELIQN